VIEQMAANNRGVYQMPSGGSFFHGQPPFDAPSVCFNDVATPAVSGLDAIRSPRVIFATSWAFSFRPLAEPYPPFRPIVSISPHELYNKKCAILSKVSFSKKASFQPIEYTSINRLIRKSLTLAISFTINMKVKSSATVAPR